MSDRVQKHGERIPQETRNKVSLRYHTITRAINTEFWNISSDTQHSLYVGSYGRNTAINSSDVDILVELPGNFFDKYNNLNGNIQSRLLQAVRSAILTTYPRSDVRADGQVVKITYSDDMYFEIIPTFRSWNGSFVYPDTHSGGSWKSTNPKAEQEAMAQKNRNSNGLLYDTCRHIRYIRDNSFSSYHLSGIVIDSFVYSGIGNWRWLNSGESSTQPSGTYEQVLLDFYNQSGVCFGTTLNAPGSNDIVYTSSSCECLGKVLRSMV